MKTGQRSKVARCLNKSLSEQQDPSVRCKTQENEESYQQYLQLPLNA